jgi:hypothetical protein
MAPPASPRRTQPSTLAAAPKRTHQAFGCGSLSESWPRCGKRSAPPESHLIVLAPIACLQGE